MVVGPRPPEPSAECREHGIGTVHHAGDGVAIEGIAWHHGELGMLQGQARGVAQQGMDFHASSQRLLRNLPPGSSRCAKQCYFHWLLLNAATAS
jgi:hypothetical protein